MFLKIKLKPRTIRRNTRQEVMNAIRCGHCYTVSPNHSCLQPLSRSFKEAGGKVRVYNLQKIRKKTRQIKYKNGNVKTGAVKGRTRKSEIVRKAEWIAHVYDVDVALLKGANIHIRQRMRTFSITNLK